jgi:hypothetical protein
VKPLGTRYLGANMAAETRRPRAALQWRGPGWGVDTPGAVGTRGPLGRADPRLTTRRIRRGSLCAKFMPWHADCVILLRPRNGIAAARLGRTCNWGVDHAEPAEAPVP